MILDYIFCIVLYCNCTGVLCITSTVRYCTEEYYIPVQDKVGVRPHPEGHHPGQVYGHSGQHRRHQAPDQDPHLFAGVVDQAAAAVVVL